MNIKLICVTGTGMQNPDVDPTQTRAGREGFSLIIALAAAAIMVTTVVVVASFISIETRRS